MTRWRMRVVKMEEVKIERVGDCVIYTYVDPQMGSMSITLGPRVKDMSDQELLDLHNEHVRERITLASQYKHEAVEFVGQPQIEYSAQCSQWVPRGDVIRCGISSDGSDKPVIEIDEQNLSLEEFGTMLLTHEGWGMRLIFVPEDELHKTPQIKLG